VVAAHVESRDVPGQQVPDTAVTDLTALVAEAAAFWAEPAARHGVGLRCERPQPSGPPQEAVAVRTDAFRVRQLIDGLVQNALRVTPAGRPVVLAVHPADDGGARLEVRDGGPGLTDDDVRVAFDSGALHERYRSVRPVGSGLGLAIAHRLAGLLGGSVAVQGHGPEGGAAFTVTLPPGPPGC
jgi:two-component system sensor histidine kinase BaeS